MFSKRLFAPILLLCLGSVLGGCAACGQQAACSLRGTINQPENRSLRRSMMAGGIENFCSQLLLHSAPLRFQNDQPSVGRYFPATCTQKEAANGDLTVEFSGMGYAWTNLTRKLVFSMSASVQYNQDFLIPDEGDCDLYGYFRPRTQPASDFRVTVIEQQATSFLNQYTNTADTFGKQLVAGKLRDGFTVVHGESGSDEVTLGILALGTKPFRPISTKNSGSGNAIVYENNRAEIHQNEREFVGPIAVPNEGQGIVLKAQVDGGIPLDVFVMGRAEGDASLKLYLTYPTHGPLAAAPRWADVIPAAQPGFARTIPLPRGVYYVIFDNTPSAGVINPPQNFADDRAALVDYAIQVGSVP